jgi:hypothetical protein
MTIFVKRLGPVVQTGGWGVVWAARQLKIIPTTDSALVTSSIDEFRNREARHFFCFIHDRPVQARRR